MKPIVMIAVIGLLASTVCAAESKDHLASAAKELANKPNYSWTSSTKEADGSTGRLGPIEGKTEKGGLTYLSFEIGGGGIQVEVYMNGEKGAAKALEGWQTFDEIAETSSAAAAIVRFLRTYKMPAADSAALGEKVKELKEAEGTWSGELKEEAVKEMLQQGGRRREGQDPPKIADAKGSLRIWTKDGTLAKYEIKVQGKVTRGERESDVNRTTTVEIKDVGSTKLEVPAEAKEKLK
jgi:hypothetical protein